MVFVLVDMDHMGVRITEWYSHNSHQIFGKTLPLVICLIQFRLLQIIF